MKTPQPKTPLDRILETERIVHQTSHDLRRWVTNPDTIAALRRAEYLISEVRQAAYFLTDPECTTHLKNEALTRLELAIINCM